MAKDWGGKTYDEDWNEIDAMGNRIGAGKDYAANAAWAGATGGQNPYTNQAGSSPWDKSGLIPGNEAGSTLAPVQAGGTSVPTTASNGLDSAVMSKLLSEINLGPTVDQNDPAYRQQVDANQVQTDRAADRARAASAQRRAATGTATSGAVDTDVNRILANQATEDKSFEAGLLDKFRGQNLDRIARALSLGTGLLSQEQEQALRKSLTEQGYGLQRDLGMQDLNFRRDALAQQGALSQAQLDQQAILALLNG